MDEDKIHVIAIPVSELAHELIDESGELIQRAVELVNEHKEDFTQAMEDKDPTNMPRLLMEMMATHYAFCALGGIPVHSMLRSMYQSSDPLTDLMLTVTIREKSGLSDELSEDEIEETERPKKKRRDTNGTGH